jgi:hypothetical protein
MGGFETLPSILEMFCWFVGLLTYNLFALLMNIIGGWFVNKSHHCIRIVGDLVSLSNFVKSKDAGDCLFIKAYAFVKSWHICLFMLIRPRVVSSWSSSLAILTSRLQNKRDVIWLSMRKTTFMPALSDRKNWIPIILLSCAPLHDILEDWLGWLFAS